MIGDIRRRSDERMILDALDKLRPEHAGPFAIARLAGLSGRRSMRAAHAIARLSAAGVIEEVSVGQRTVYRMAS